MKRRIVKGSHLLWSAGYDEAKRILEVRLKNKDGTAGTIYQYSDVPPAKWKAFCTAPSAGKFFLNSVKPFHGFERIDDAKAKAEAEEPAETHAEEDAAPPTGK